MMVIMSAVRCICILTILGRHHYYCNCDDTAMMVFFVMPVPLRLVSVISSKLISKLTSTTVNQEVVMGTVITPLLIHSVLLSLFHLLLCMTDPSSPWLADRVLMSCILLVNHLGEVQKLRKRMIADERLGTRRVYAQPSISAAAIVPVADEAGVLMITAPYRLQDETTVTDDLPDEVYVERLKKFMDATRGVLWVQVSATFLVIITAEIVLSMVLYQQTGTPTAWCAPFAFRDVDKGFQVVLDFFL
jgi:hypothetical protein